jgi:hypothetical protein
MGMEGVPILVSKVWIWIKGPVYYHCKVPQQGVRDECSTRAWVVIYSIHSQIFIALIFYINFDHLSYLRKLNLWKMKYIYLNYIMNKSYYIWFFITLIFLIRWVIKVDVKKSNQQIFRNGGSSFKINMNKGVFLKFSSLTNIFLKFHPKECRHKRPNPAWANDGSEPWALLMLSCLWLLWHSHFHTKTDAKITSVLRFLRSTYI